MQEVVYLLWVFDIADRQIAHVCLDDDRAKAEKLPTHSWYIIADVVDFGQFELYDITTEEAVLRYLANTLIRHYKHREIPHDVLVGEKDKPEHKPTQWQQEQLKLRLPDQRWNTRDH